MTTLFRLSLVVVLATSFALDAAAQTAARGLAGTSWNAVELAGTPVPAEKSDRRPHLIFAAEGRVTGADGCNNLGGSYTVKDDTISFGPMIATRMACPGLDELAMRFSAALKGTGRWRIANGRLEFYGATGKPLAIFERRAATP